MTEKFETCSFALLASTPSYGWRPLVSRCKYTQPGLSCNPAAGIFIGLS